MTDKSEILSLYLCVIAGGVYGSADKYISYSENSVTVAHFLGLFG